MTSGSGYNSHYLSETEILNFGNTVGQSPQFQDHPKSIYGATGGFLNEEFITCGGYILDELLANKCFKLGSEGPFVTMYKERFRAASVFLNPGKLWILGGADKYFDSLSSTEYIFADGRNHDGPPMPIGLTGHAMVKINQSIPFLVGGLDNDGFSNRTWFYDGKWLEGPDLQKARYQHSVGTLRDPVTAQVYIVVAGGWGMGMEILNDVEILSVTGTAWETGNLL